MKKAISGTTFISVILILSFTCPSSASDRIIVTPDGNSYFASYTGKGKTYLTMFDKNNNKLSWNHLVQDNYHLNNVSLDKTGNKFAYVEYRKLQNANQSEGTAQGFYRLVILDVKNSKEIASFSHGFYFSFSPNGNEIAFAERVAGEEGTLPPPDYQGGAWLYNLNSKSQKHIDTGTIGVMDINWSSHDGNIYVTNNAEVYCYNPRTGKGKIVPYHGIYFSPDGKYYVQTGDEGGAWLYRTSDNKEMTDWEYLIRREAENYPNASFNFICWSKKLNMAIFSAGEDKIVIFDPGKAKIAGSFRPGLIGFNADGTKAAVHPLASDRRIQKDKVEILNLLDLIKK